MLNEKADRASREGRVISIARVSPSTVGDHRISGSPPSWKSSRVITGRPQLSRPCPECPSAVFGAKKRISPSGHPARRECSPSSPVLRGRSAGRCRRWSRHRAGSSRSSATGRPEIGSAWSEEIRFGVAALDSTLPPIPGSPPNRAEAGRCVAQSERPHGRASVCGSRPCPATRPDSPHCRPIERSQRGDARRELQGRRKRLRSQCGAVRRAAGGRG